MDDKALNEVLKPLEQLLELSTAKKDLSDFITAFEGILGIFQSIKADNETERQWIRAEMSAAVGDLQKRLSELRNGDDGKTPTEKDEKDLVRLIKPLIPVVQHGKHADEKQIEKTVTQNVQKLIPTIEQIEKDIPKLGEPIRDALEILPEGKKLAIAAIEGLLEELRAVKEAASKHRGANFVVSRGAVKEYDLSPNLDGSTKTFALPAFHHVIDVKLWSASALRQNTDYTVDGSAMTITFTSQVDAATLLAVGQTCLVIYSEP